MRARQSRVRFTLAALGLLALASAARAEDPPSMLVALALDTSGSVGRADLGRARDLASAILAALPAGSEVAVLAFDDQSRLVVPRTSRADEVRARLAALRVAGRYTALHDAIYDASRYVRDAPGARKAIVLVTDGLDENSALDLDDGLKVAQQSRIPVFTVAVGAHPQERVLRRIAKLTGGEYLRLEHARGAELAARIAAVGPRPGDGRTAAGAPAASSASALSDVRAESPPATRSRSRAMVWTVIALTAAVAVGLVLALRRARPPACATCGRALPAGQRTCRSCVRPPAGVSAPAGLLVAAPTPLAPEPELSATVLERMNATEEYLERTITLLERPVLAVTRGTRAGEVFELSEATATSIGRSRVNDIQVIDVSVSSQHCRVRLEDGRFVVHDLKSTNGTIVNEKRVSRHVLEEGDVIAIGETAFQYRRDLKRS
jgi:hypothetical protein